MSQECFSFLPICAEGDSAVQRHLTLEHQNCVRNSTGLVEKLCRQILCIQYINNEMQDTAFHCHVCNKPELQRHTTPDYMSF